MRKQELRNILFEIKTDVNSTEHNYIELYYEIIQEKFNTNFLKNVVAEAIYHQCLAFNEEITRGNINTAILLFCKNGNIKFEVAYSYLHRLNFNKETLKARKRRLRTRGLRWYDER
jgi:hypothetical protein